MRGRGRLAEGENGGLLMRGKGCWRLGGSVTKISKAGGAACGWLRLEDERMKKRWKGRGAGLFFGRLRGRRKRREKAGFGEKGLLVLWSGLCGGAVDEMEKIFSSFRLGEKIRFRVFCVCPKFLSLKNLSSVNFPPLCI